TRRFGNLPFQFIVSERQQRLTSATLIVSTLKANMGNSARNRAGDGGGTFARQNGVEPPAAVRDGGMIAFDLFPGLDEIQGKGRDIVIGRIPRTGKDPAFASQRFADDAEENEKENEPTMRHGV